MAGEGGREGPDVSRRIRDELERIRAAESRVEEALETLRQARRRVEVAARELGREEERVRAWVRDELEVAGARGPEPAGETGAESGREAPLSEAGARGWRSDASVGWSTWRDNPPRAREPGAIAAREPAAKSPPGPSTAEPRSPGPDDARALPRAPERIALPAAAIPATLLAGAEGASEKRAVAAWNRRIALGLAAALAVALVGWFAIRGLRRQAGTSIATEAPAAPSVAAPPPRPEVPPASGLTPLPAEAAARQTLYDSLFAARSPLFDPLLDTIRAETADRGVLRALSAWKEGPVDAQDADLVHSALLQHVLKSEVDPRIEVDGQVLRDPCRGRSCSALLNAWEHRQAEYGLPPVPERAPTDARQLRRAEAALVLAWLRDESVARPPAGGR